MPAALDNYAYAYEDHEAVMSACTCPVDHPIATRRAAAANVEVGAQPYSTGNSACEVECRAGVNVPTNGASTIQLLRRGTGGIAEAITLENSAGATWSRASTR